MRLIDADALQKVFMEECIQECSTCIYSKPWLRAEDGFGRDWQGCELIDNAPTVEDRPIGKWQKIEDSTVSCKCSVCGFAYHLYEDDIYGYKYCANCGARMEEKNE